MAPDVKGTKAVFYYLWTQRTMIEKNSQRTHFLSSHRIPPPQPLQLSLNPRSPYAPLSLTGNSAPPGENPQSGYIPPQCCRTRSEASRRAVLPAAPPEIRERQSELYPKLLLKWRRISLILAPSWVGQQVCWKTASGILDERIAATSSKSSPFSGQKIAV